MTLTADATESLMLPGEFDSATARLVATMRADMLVGRPGPGTELTETAIAAQYRVSRTTVRTAVLELERLGLVEREPGRPAVVARPGFGELRDLMRIRNDLEPMLVSRFVERATPAQMVAFGQAHQRLDAALATGDRPMIGEARRAYYEKLYQGASSWPLASTVEREHARLTLARVQLLGWQYELARLRHGATYRQLTWTLMHRRETRVAYQTCTRHMIEDAGRTVHAIEVRRVG